MDVATPEHGFVDTTARLAEFGRGVGGAAGSGSIPRALGWHDFTVGGAKGRRLVYPYTVWMFQRPLSISVQVRRTRTRTHTHTHTR
jgi:hypothetical protein